MLSPESLHSSVVFAAYAEPLAQGRRVLVVGNASSGLADHLVDRGARLVAVFDPDPARAAEAATRAPSQNISFAPLSDGAWALRDAAFDCAIVEDLGAMGEPADLMRRVRRALSPRGVALVACPNHEVKTRLLPASFPVAARLDYYRLYDLVSEHFEQVKMLGQAPFVGYAIVAFSPEGDPEPAIDTGFLPAGGEEPEHFIALASHQAASLEQFAVIELPARNVIGQGSGRSAEEVGLARAAEQRARDELAKSEAERLRLEQALRERAVVETTAAELAALRAEVEKRDVWVSQLEARADTADARADAAEEELEAESGRAEKLEQQLADAHGRAAKLEQQLAEARGRVARLEERVGDHEARAAEAQRALADREARGANLERRVSELEETLAHVRQAAADSEGQKAVIEGRLRDAEQQLSQAVKGDEEESAREVAALEAQLSERARAIRDLERSLAEAERIGRELVEELERSMSAPAEAPSPEVVTELPAVERPVAAPVEETAAAAATEPLELVQPPLDGEGRAELVAKLNHLASLNAEQEADLLAARWRVAELEARLDETLRTADQDLGDSHAELGRKMALLAQIRAR